MKLSSMEEKSILNLIKNRDNRQIIEVGGDFVDRGGEVPNIDQMIHNGIYILFKKFYIFKIIKYI